MVKIYNFRKQHVGDVVEDTYYSVRKPQHYMVKFNGFGISDSILEELKILGVKTIQINYIGRNGVKLFTCDINKYLNTNKLFTFKEGKMEDLQKFVGVEDMEPKEEDKERQTKLDEWL